MAALRELGLEAPHDFSLVGFDDMPFAELLHPPLTTVRQPIEEMGRKGVRTLLGQIKDGQPPSLVRLATELVVRGSVAPPLPTRSPVSSGRATKNRVREERSGRGSHENN